MLTELNKRMDILEEGFEHIWLPYTQMKNAPLPPLVQSTKGNYIILEDGTKLIDGISSWWSACHGYNHPHIIKETAKQLKKMPHVMLAGLANEPAYKLTTRLVKFVNSGHENAPTKVDRFTEKKLNKVFLSDSGSIAVEVALKIAIQYYINQDTKEVLTKVDGSIEGTKPDKFGSINQPKKNKIIAFHNSYHGDTMAGMSLCDPESGMHAKFKNYIPKQLTTKLPITSQDFENFENFIKENHEQAAAIIIEPLVQCSGGMKFHNSEILDKIVQITRNHHILIIFDECATGFYRTGKKFAFHHTNIVPDILVIGKALTGGTMTLAATLTTDKIYNQFLDYSLDKALMHGPTFMGNSLACAAANASLDIFESSDYTQNTEIIANRFRRELKIFNNHPLIKNIRILGAIAVLELHTEDWEFIFNLRTKLLKEKVWLRPFGNVIYFMPPLTIKKHEIRKLVRAVKNSL